MWNEITTVANEICEALGLSTKSASIAGRNAASCVTSATYWTIYDLQRLIYDNYDEFIPTADAEDFEDRTDEDAPEVHQSWASFCTAAGMYSTGFRNVTSQKWPGDWTDTGDDDYSWGTAPNYTVPDRDIVGPWNWDDIQRAFDEMRYMIKQCDWDQGNSNNNRRSFAAGGYDPSWTVVRNNYLADSGTDSFDDTWPDKRCNELVDQDPDPDEYNAHGHATRNKASFTLAVLATVDATVTFFHRAKKHYYAPPFVGSYVWAQNEDEVEEDEWHEWDEIVNPASALVRSAYLGDLDRPVIGSFYPTASDYHIRGWSTPGGGTTKGPHALIKFDRSYTR